jgi:GNAT superfamily N-acetyltransferase
MGLDTQLIADGAYFVVASTGALAGCGGWSRRAALYGSDHTQGRSPRLLDPATEPARLRAMYTHPDHVRKGAGKLILHMCEQAGRAEGFRAIERMATLSGGAAVFELRLHRSRTRAGRTRRRRSPADSHAQGIAVGTIAAADDAAQSERGFSGSCAWPCR